MVRIQSNTLNLEKFLILPEVKRANEYIDGAEFNKSNRISIILLSISIIFLY
jgi:hypothetical protein